MATKEKAKRAPRQTATGDETKAQKFVRLAEARTGKALKMIDNLSKLSGNGYERSPEQCAEIVAALRGAVDNLEQRFAGQTKVATAFKLGAKK